MLKRNELIEFILIMVSIWFTLLGSNITNIYLMVFGPIMVVVYLLIRFPLHRRYLNKYVGYTLAVILALITVGTAMTNIGLGIVALTKYLISVIGLSIIFERLFQVTLSFLVTKNIITGNEGISWRGSFSIIAIGWMVYLLPFLPGNIAGDGNFQLVEFFGRAPMTNHHPYLSTMFEGGIFDIGRQLFGDNFGLFLYVIVQAMICCLIFSFCISEISKLGLSKKWGAFLSGIVGFIPYWSFASETLHKDGMFLALFALYVLMLIITTRQLFIEKRKLTGKQWIAFIVSALLVCFWRNDGIYMAVPPIFCLIFVEGRKYWRQFAYSLVAVLAIYVAFNKVLLPVLHVAPTEQRETLSLPAQQTARYLKYHPNDITKHDRKVLEKSFNHLDKLGEVYNPTFADPVKSNIKKHLNIKDYFLTWLHMGLQHPLVYVKATFEGTNAYYNPWLPAQDFSWAGAMASFSKPTFLNLHYITSVKVRVVFLNIVRKVSTMPFINLFFNSVLGIWLCVLMSLYLWKSFSFKYFIPFIPVFMNLLICIASPINGLVRYSGCTVFATYCLIAYCFFVLKRLGKGDKNA